MASPPSAAGAAVTAAATTAASAATAAASAGRKLHTPLLAVASMTTGLVGGVPPVTRASRSQVHQGGGGGGVRGQHDEEGVDGDFRPSGLPQRIGSASSHGSEDSESAHPCGPGTHGSAAVAELGLEGLRLHPAWIIGGPCRSGALVERRPGVVLWHRQPLSWRHSRVRTTGRGWGWGGCMDDGRDTQVGWVDCVHECTAMILESRRVSDVACMGSGCGFVPGLVSRRTC
mgnify:CR=1 FL=1